MLLSRKLKPDGVYWKQKGVKVTMIQGTNYNVFGLVGDTTVIDDRMITANPYVDNVKRIAAPYKKANRLFHPLDSVIDVDGIKVGGKEKIVVIGGPCSVEGEGICYAHCKGGKKRQADACCAAVHTSQELLHIHFKAWV